MKTPQPKARTFRFTAEMFNDISDDPRRSQQDAARIANTILDAEEKKCERVYREYDRWTNLPPEHLNFKTTPLKHTHTALLWNVSSLPSGAAGEDE